MGCSTEDIEFSPSSVSVSCVILAVEAVAAAVSIGVYTIISHSDSLMGRDIVLGSMILLIVTLIASLLAIYCSKKRRKSILMQETLVYLKTYSGLEEIVFYEEIESVKNSGENLIIKLKDGRIVAMISEDFKNSEKQALFVEELGRRVARIQGGGDEKGQESGKRAA